MSNNARAARATRAAATTRAAGTRRAAAAGGRAATPWGEATVLGQVVVQQRAGEKRFSTVVQLLETAHAERLVRFAYATDGSARRGPVTLRRQDVVRLCAALERSPELRAALLGERHAG